ncbi:gamma-glutamylcyclotransferase [Francisellaceae bacterium CB300]
MELLFSYGTLQLENVQTKTFGRLLNGTNDILIGYTISKIEISDKEVIATSGERYHPILKYTGINTDMVKGTVFEITSEELDQADEYEVKEYSRIQARLKSGRNTWIYAAC